ncbi:MAG: NAD-dependent epimerase/dehydratase family protein [Kiritimatiellae bacterium]|nr:NAD-dependent epimerase/dehydratase family protein [Kiritimatiellia bacterium]
MATDKNGKTVLVTGANGFVGKNLCLALSRCADVELLRYDIGNTESELREFASRADFIFHLAGVNRPKDPSEFVTGNAGLTETLVGMLEESGRAIPILLSSSVQAELDNPYGKSKRLAEEVVGNYAKKAGTVGFVYRLSNVFGKWCRPNYNSAVATWCYNIARGLPIQVRDPQATVTLVYIDDVVNEFLSAFRNAMDDPTGVRERMTQSGYLSVPEMYTRTLGEITDILYAFRKTREDFSIPDQGDPFLRKLYATYLSYLPEENFSYPLTMRADARGSFTEFIRTSERGQVSVNVAHPGIVKGNHWHHTKHEKFLVVKGCAVIRFRRMDVPDSPVIEYHVSDEKLEVVEIPPGYTHNIENVGETDLVTVMWANEPFDPERPDTFAEQV